MSDSKILIAYFSHTGMNVVRKELVHLDPGNTAVAAQEIEEITGGDLFEIRKKGGYPFDFKETAAIANQEHDEMARPELEALPENFDDYSTVILCYPNWCGDMPMPVYTFLEAFDFSKKRILPLITSEGSGICETRDVIMQICLWAKVTPALELIGADVADAKPAIQEWLDKNLG